MPYPTDTRSDPVDSIAAESPGVVVRDPARRPMHRSADTPETDMMMRQVSTPAAMIPIPMNTYAFAFPLKFPKKWGPAIKPTEATKHISPRF